MKPWLWRRRQVSRCMLGLMTNPCFSRFPVALMLHLIVLAPPPNLVDVVANSFCPSTTQ